MVYMAPAAYLDYNHPMGWVAKVGRSGNSFVIRIPREDLEREGIALGDYVLVSLQAVDIRPRLKPELRASMDRMLAKPETAQAIGRLADA